MPRSATTKDEAAKHESRSVDTELFYPCPENLVDPRHKHLPVAMRIKRGPRRFWFLCSICGTQVKFGKQHQAEWGLTHEQALREGLTPL